MKMCFRVCEHVIRRICGTVILTAVKLGLSVSLLMGLVLTLEMAGCQRAKLAQLSHISLPPTKPPTIELLTPKPTATWPPTWTPTPNTRWVIRATPTPQPTVKITPTSTDTPTPSPLPSPPTPTLTPTPLPTVTPLPTATPLPTPTDTPLAIAHVRPTAVPIHITPSPHPSVTLPIPTAVLHQPIPDEALTIVLLGSDQRPDWDYWNTDVIQYVVVYPDIPSVAMLSIPRDLYVFVPNFWMARINRADLYGERYQYDGGGLGLLNQTLLYNLGISADYYVKVNFDGLIGLVNAMGGIEVPVYCPLSDYWPYPNEAGEYYHITLTPGIHEMDGELALWYSRSRKTTSVFARERRQQQVLEAMWRKAKGANMLASAPALYEQTHHLFQTDLELGQMLVLAVTAAKLDAVDVRRYNIGWGEVTPYTTIYGGNVYLPIWERIQPIIEDVLARPAASRAFRAANRVEVWNRTGHPEWDLVAADQLYHYGYIPITGSTPDHNVQPRTKILFFGSTLKGSGITWLQSLFNVSQENVIHQEDPRADVKLRLVLGQDYDPCR